MENQRTALEKGNLLSCLTFHMDGLAALGIIFNLSELWLEKQSEGKTVYLNKLMRLM